MGNLKICWSLNRVIAPVCRMQSDTSKPSKRLLQSSRTKAIAHPATITPVDFQLRAMSCLYQPTARFQPLLLNHEN